MYKVELYIISLAYKQQRRFDIYFSIPHVQKAWNLKIDEDIYIFISLRRGNLRHTLVNGSPSQFLSIVFDLESDCQVQSILRNGKTMFYRFYSSIYKETNKPFFVKFVWKKFLFALSQML